MVIEEILEGEDRPEDVISKLLFKTAYTKSPYQYPVIGYQDIVEKTTVKHTGFQETMVRA